MRKWPFNKLDMKPGSLHEVRATCSFAYKWVTDKYQDEFELIEIEKGTILMFLEWEVMKENSVADFRFKFLHGEYEVFLPISFRNEIDENSTEEEKIEAIQVLLFTYVKPMPAMSHGYRPVSVPVEPYLIGDNRLDDDDGWDEFH